MGYAFRQNNICTLPRNLRFLGHFNVHLWIYGSVLCIQTMTLHIYMQIHIVISTRNKYKYIHDYIHVYSHICSYFSPALTKQTLEIIHHAQQQLGLVLLPSLMQSGHRILSKHQFLANWLTPSLEIRLKMQLSYNKSKISLNRICSFTIRNADDAPLWVLSFINPNYFSPHFGEVLMKLHAMFSCFISVPQKVPCQHLLMGFAAIMHSNKS